MRKSGGRLTQFRVVPSDLEDQILGPFADLAGPDAELHLRQVPELMYQLEIPHCFTKDIETGIDFYYANLHGRPVDVSDHRHHITAQLVRHFTITTLTDDDLVDIVDIDKLIARVGKLLKFRDNYDTIVDAWRLFVGAATADDLDNQTLLGYQLALPDLKAIKGTLGLDDGVELGDSFLIDMLGCCQTDVKGDITNYSFDRIKRGSSVGIKDFAEILGNLGEFDERLTN